MCDLCTATKRPWTNDEILAVHADLGQYFVLHSLPPKVEIVACQTKHPALRNRSWLRATRTANNSYKQLRYRRQTAQRKWHNLHIFGEYFLQAEEVGYIGPRLLLFFAVHENDKVYSHFIYYLPLCIA